MTITPMKTILLPIATLNYLRRLPRLLVIPALAIAFAAPAAEAQQRGNGHWKQRGGSSGDYGVVRGYEHHRAPNYAPYHAPRHAPRYSYPARSWGGFYGAHPPVGYVTYRHIPVLPRYYRVVYYGGFPYYYANGGYYWPMSHEGARVFVQVRF
jgi:hypothetical protein